MTAIEYFIYSLLHNYVHKITWYYSMLTIPVDNSITEYATFENGKAYLKTEEGMVELKGYKPNVPILGIRDEVTIEKNIIPNITEPKIVTTIGRAILNKVILADNFGNRIPYVNEPTTTKKLEQLVLDRMYGKDIISVAEYINFTTALSFITSLSRITNVSVTEKSMLPPTGILQFKNKLIKEMDDKYGVEWRKNRARVIEFEDAMRKYDNEYLKDEVTNGKFLNKKIKETARSKQFLTYGAERGFDKKDEDIKLIEESLLEGYTPDKNTLSTVFNTSRAGSLDRGKNTQKGGAAAKYVLRAISSFSIVDGDCGATRGKLTYVNSVNQTSMLGRYIITNKLSTPITDPSAYLNKVIEIRSPMWCKQGNSSFCSVCVGETMSKYKQGISLLSADITGVMLALSLKAMHSVKINTITVDITDIIS